MHELQKLSKSFKSIIYEQATEDLNNHAIQWPGFIQMSHLAISSYHFAESSLFFVQTQKSIALPSAVLLLILTFHFHFLLNF